MGFVRDSVVSQVEMGKMRQACKNLSSLNCAETIRRNKLFNYGLHNLMWSNFENKLEIRSQAKLLQLKLGIFKSSSKSIIIQTCTTFVNGIILDRERSVSKVTYGSWDRSIEVVVG
jgi:hypothetical protein